MKKEDFVSENVGLKSILELSKHFLVNGIFGHFGLILDHANVF